jgi:acetoin utilization protein AcuB
MLAAPDLTVDQVMTRPAVSVSMDDSLKVIQERFAQHHFHHLLVVEGKRLVGLISDRDLFQHLSPFVGNEFSERAQDLATLNRRAHQIMSRQLITTTRTTTIAGAIKLILENDISCLPIVDEQMRPQGIITWRDLLRSLQDRDEPKC